MTKLTCFLLGHNLVEIKHDVRQYICSCCGNIAAPTLHSLLHSLRTRRAKVQENLPIEINQISPDELQFLRQAAERVRQQRRERRV